MNLRPEAGRPTEKLRCLVIQLARIGDTLQSLMALRAAKQLYPELEIHFLARGRFAQAAKRVPWIHSVIEFPSDSILAPVLKGEKREIDALRDLAKWIAPLVQKPWDLIVNWSFSEASSYITGLLPGRIKLGYTRRMDNTFASADAWTNFVQAVVQGDLPQNIHLTDILTTQLLTALQIHMGDPRSDGNMPVTSKTFFSLDPKLSSKASALLNSNKKWVAIQLGAALESKTWPVDRWAKTVEYLLERQSEYQVVLLGSAEEKVKAAEFINLLPPVLRNRIRSLVGETDFDLWASVVAKSRWLLSGDTAAIHLASVLGTRVVNISVGPVKWVETGPYGNGHYVIAPKNTCNACVAPGSGTTHNCKTDVTPEAVFATWSYAATEWNHRRTLKIEDHFSVLGWRHHLGQVQVRRSMIRTTETGGGVHYEPLTQIELSLNEWTSMVTGQIARNWYCGWVPPMGQDLIRTAIGTDLIQKLRILTEPLEVLTKIIDEAIASSTTLHHRSSKMKSPKLVDLALKSELNEIAIKLQDLDLLLDRMGITHSSLRLFSRMSKVLMHNLKGSDISTLGKESKDSYKQLKEGATMMKEWIAHTLSLARPVALKTADIVRLRPGTEVPL